MFDPNSLTRAVRLQKASYDVLRKLQDRVDLHKIPVASAHDALDEVSAARHWVNVAVASDEYGPEDIVAIANLFASYLTTSFDLDEDPGTRWASDCGCVCVCCRHVEQLPHLRPKKLGPADKARAHRMMLGVLRARSLESGHELSDDEAEAFAADAELAESIALVAYCEQLLRRLEGERGEPAVLALWRKFAWTKTGAPKSGFRLDVAGVLEAERRVVARIASRG